jgi:hypothetical protein
MWGARHGLRVSCRSILGALGMAVILVNAGCPDTMVPAPGVQERPFEPAVSSSSSGASVGSGSSGGGCGFCPSSSQGPVCPPGSPLDCFVNKNCPGGTATTITGTVFDPAGRNPLPNVVVYVPNVPNRLAPLPTGTVGCTLCNRSIGDFVTFAFTDSSGHFELTGVPTGNNVPLVVEIGKWRRMIAVPHVTDCQTTQLPSSASGVARLPRNRSEGSLPRMALLTGGCDNVACFLRSVGVDASEFTAPGAGGSIDVYQGLGATGPGAALSNGISGDCTTSGCPLWSNKTALEPYDQVFLGCECDEHVETKPASSLLALRDWVGEGGEVFATHSQATWFKNGPSDVQSIANWTSGPSSGALGPFAIDTGFGDGRVLEAWLANLGAADSNGIVTLAPTDVSTSVTTVAPSARGWVHDRSTGYDGGAAAGNVKLLTAAMPMIAGDAATVACGGAVVFSDIHPGGGQALQEPSSDGSSVPAPVPAACDGGPLTPEEEVLEFLLFHQQCGSNAGGGGGPPPPPPQPDGG